MKLQKILDDFLECSGKVSDLCRQYAFAGIATIWVLRTSAESGIAFSDALLQPLLAFVLSLSVDFLQYLYKCLALWYFNNKEWDRTHNPDADVDYPDSYNWLTNGFFFIKIAITIGGYILLLSYIADQI